MSVLDFHRRMFDHSLYNYRHYVVFIIMTYSWFNFLTSIFPSGLFDYQSVYTDLCAAIKTEIMVIRIKKMNTKICVIHNSWFWGIQIFVKDNVFIRNCSSLMKISVVLLSAEKTNETWWNLILIQIELKHAAFQYNTIEMDEKHSLKLNTVHKWAPSRRYMNTLISFNPIAHWKQLADV